MATFCLSERVNEATEREPKLSAKRMPQCGLKWTPNGQSFRWSLRWREGMLRGKREKERGWTGGELVCVHGGWLKSTKILSYKTLKGENRGECCQTTRQEILVGEIVVSDHNQELFVIKVSTNRGWRRLWMQISLPKKPFSNKTKMLIHDSSALQKGALRRGGWIVASAWTNHFLTKIILQRN